MPFTKENANVNHYPGTSKAAIEDGYERSEMPADDGSQNMGRLTGRTFDTCDNDPVKDSD
jgi:hypothetical protein